jgi:hypothetical protein
VSLGRPPAQLALSFQGTKASNKHLKSSIQNSEIYSPWGVQKDNEQLTLRLLTSRQTGDTLRPMDVLHARGQHSAVPLLDSANNCDREFGRARVARTFFTTDTRRHGEKRKWVSVPVATSRSKREELLSAITNPFPVSSVTPCLRGEKEVHVKFPLLGGRTLTNR